ncbi:hypothetical protein [[Mycobacterium] vasticus]|uniref:PE-PGRS family protein n=1 Tax=[Mycobacterium] vasticus TaxID=2875777 RepID=A0ABU5YXU5_9MYCO|nr:hypothetical protein [Mycolicibacter sp. MYC017]MEB3069955.1 hypothetical protein [Mycolicibacter sp. MYC017]
MTRAGVVAAGAALTGAAAFGAGGFAPEQSGGFFSHVQQDVALTAVLGEGNSFVDALQNALTGANLGTIGQLLGLLGTDANGAPLFDSATPLFTAAVIDQATGQVTTPEGGLLTALTTFDGAPLTLNGVGSFLGLPLNEALWTDAVGADGVTRVDSVLGAGSMFTLDVNGTPTALGDMTLNELAGVLLGGDVASKTVGDLFNGLGLGGLAGFVTLLCDPGVECTPNLLAPGAGQLTVDDTISQLLGSLLKVDTSTETLGGYLGTIQLAPGQDLASATLGGLLNLPPTESLASYLAGMTLGGGTILNPTTPFELGSLDLGGLLGMLAGGATIGDSTLTGDWLIDLGLFGSPS